MAYPYLLPTPSLTPPHDSSIPERERLADEARRMLEGKEGWPTMICPTDGQRYPAHGVYVGTHRPYGVEMACFGWPSGDRLTAVDVFLDQLPSALTVEERTLVLALDLNPRPRTLTPRDSLYHDAQKYLHQLEAAPKGLRARVMAVLEKLVRPENWL